ncbi:MAG: hypothetical protein J2P17_30270, partial [Mycobacterium sp.]|nr:hypothetical protein [Mycobacterium sp.]
MTLARSRYYIAEKLFDLGILARKGEVHGPETRAATTRSSREGDSEKAVASMTTEFHPPTRQCPASPTGRALAALRPLGLDAVHLDPSGLLGRWQERNAITTLPHCIRKLDESGAMDNVRRAIGEVSGAHVGMWFSDS